MRLNCHHYARHPDILLCAGSISRIRNTYVRIDSMDLGQLEKLDIFHGLSPVDLKQIVTTGRARNFSAGEYIYMQGDPADRLYVLHTGKVKLSQVTPDGQQVIHQVAGPGEAFGLLALLEGMEYPVTAQVAVASQVYTWTQVELRHLIERVPMFSINMMHIMAMRIQEFQDRLRELATERVERRIARTLIRLARQTGRKTDEGVLIDIPLTRQDLAEMCGTTVFTVSRTLSSWEQQGIIQSKRERVIIVIPHGLVQIAEELPSK